MTDTALAQLLEKLDLSGVRLSVDRAGDLRIHGAKQLAPELLNTIRSLKSQIVGHLSNTTSSAAHSALPLRGSGRPAGEALTAMQRAIWLTCQIEPDSIAYNMPHGLQIRGRLDVGLLRECIRQLHQRHCSLRTRFITVEGEPRQVVDAGAELPFSIVDACEADLAAVLAAESDHVFNLEAGPLFYVKIFRVSSEHHVFLFNAHHIVFDGWSGGVFLRELSLLYSAAGNHELQPLPFDYLDFSRWSAEINAPDSVKRSQAFWKTLLGGAPEQLAFPTDRARPAKLTTRACTVDFQIPEQVAQSARALCRQRGVTLYQLLLSAFQVLLLRYSGQRDVVVGVPFANRGFRELESLVGYFVNPLPIRQVIDPRAPFADLLTNNKQRMLQVLAHQDYPLAQIVSDLNPARDLSHSPIFQHVFSFEVQDDTALRIPGAEVALLAPAEPAAKFDLWFSMTDSRRGLSGAIQFNTALFEVDSARRWAANFSVLLQGICADPTRPIVDLPCMDPAERAFIGACLDKSGQPFRPQFQRIQHAFEECARSAPCATALRCGDQVLSYGELDSRANAIAGYLRAGGVVAGSLVGICMRRTPDMLATLIAIVKLDAAYVGLDPKYPAGRLNQIAREAGGLQWVVCDASTHGWIEAAREFQVSEAPASAAPVAVAEPAADPLMYVIFTSGSTGRPKGVMVTHRGVLALMEWVRSTYDAADLEAVLLGTSIGFDMSVFEIWAPLSVGGSLVLVDDVTRLVDAPQKVSLINTVPSAVRLLVNERAVPPGVRVINVCGEPLDKGLVKDLFDRYPGITLCNVYGPTEDSVYSTASRITAASGEDPSIGVPLVHCYARVVDEHGAVAPVGAIGELYVGGPGVTKGYINNPEQTAERFVRGANYAGVEGAEFRTGDLVRLRGDGQLYFVGRRDNQVKIRGFRVELGEIEHAVQRIAGVREACVVAHKRQPGDLLVAYVVHESAARPVDAACADAIEQTLRSQLPDYMVPDTIVFLQTLPLNSNGKVDRRALMAIPVTTERSSASVEVGDRQEQLIVHIWKSLLQLEAIGLREDFFRLGGNSILAIQMIARVNKELGTSLPPRAAFEYKTVAALGAALRSAAGKTRDAVTLQHVELPEGVEPTFPQMAMLRDAGRPGFNMCQRMWIEGPLDEGALRRGLEGLVARHDGLRAKFVMDAAGVRMHVRSTVPDILRVVVMERDDRTPLGKRIRTQIDQELRLPFNLQEGPPARALLLRISAQKHVLVLSVHHVVSDIWSIDIISRDLAALYAAELDGSRPRPEPLAIGYADFVHWQRRLRDTPEFGRQVGYWMGEFADIAVKGNFPIRPESAVAPGSHSRSFELEPAADWQRRVRDSSAQKGVTPYMLLVAALQLALADYSGVEQQLVWTPISTRTQLELERSVGLYTNLMAIAERVRGDLTVAEFLALIERKVLGAHANADVTALLAVMKNPALRPALPLIGLNFLDASKVKGGWEFAGATVTPITEDADEVGLVTAIEVVVLAAPQSLGIAVNYDTAIFRAEDARQITTKMMHAAEALSGDPTVRIADVLHAWQEERQAAETQRPAPVLELMA